MGRRRKRSQSAFTVLELLVTMALAALIAAGGVLGWPRFEAALELERGLHQLAADLHAARALALASAARVRLVFTSGGHTYRRERADDADTYRVDVTRELPRGIRVADVNSGGDLIFSARGNGENGTVVLVDGRGVRRSLRLNQRGRITIAAEGQ